MTGQRMAIRSLLIALWSSLLFFPFKGMKASLVLFAAVSLSLISFTYLIRVLKPFHGSLHRLVRRARPGRISRLKVRAVFCMLIIGLLALPLLTGTYLLDVLILTGIYAVLALGLNVVVGFTGLLNLGYAAFYAIGAYTYALLNVKMGFGFWQALPVCLGLTTVSGFILAVPALRLRGDYLAIVTLGFGEIVRLILNNWDSFTRGPNGISGIAPPFVLGISLGPLNRFYYLVLFSVIVAYALIKRVRSSKIGRAWVAIREDEICAAAMGVNTTRYKLYAFAFGSLWAGLGGALFAAKMRFVSPESFTFMESVLILCMVILGGLGNLAGAVVGAFILVLLPEILREAQLYRMLVVGIGLVLVMLFRPQGLLSGTQRYADTPAIQREPYENA